MGVCLGSSGHCLGRRLLRGTQGQVCVCVGGGDILSETLKKRKSREDQVWCGGGGSRGSTPFPKVDRLKIMLASDSSQIPHPTVKLLAWPRQPTSILYL